MRAHQRRFLDRKRSGFQQNAVGDADLADVMERCSPANEIDGPIVHSECGCQCGCHLAYTLRMAACLVVPDLGGARKTIQNLHLRSLQLTRTLGDPQLEHCVRSEERRVGKECGSRWVRDP